MRKLFNHWQLILIIILGLSISWPLLKSGYFSHQDDLQVIRIVEMRKCLFDLQIPCRWVPDMGWGNGMPLFNFYGVFTYYLGGFISFITGYLMASKILFFLSLTVGSYGIYLLISRLWGKNAGLASAVLYMFAPYKALDIYVRGALTESMALTIIPFVFYFLLRKNYKLFIFSLFFFLITHNIMTIVFLPVVILWMFYLLYIEKFKDLKISIISFTLAFGLASFFVLPAFFEKGMVQTESLTRFELDYRANFISVKQLFLDRVWGYGTSIPGPEGGMNFSIGWPHWVLVVLSSIAIVFSKNRKYILLATFCILLFVFSIFMTHNKSTTIWETISILRFFQFPWRFLSLSILTASILGGFVIYVFNEKLQMYVSLFIVLVSVLFNWSYFKPRYFYDITETNKLTGQLWEDQRKGALLDYLPKTALEPREGASKLDNFNNRSNKFLLNVYVDTETQIEIPVYYFPNWEVTIDGIKTEVTHDNILGRISVKVPAGQHEIVGRFENTPLRTISNMISLVSLAVFILIWKKRKN